MIRTVSPLHGRINDTGVQGMLQCILGCCHFFLNAAVKMATQSKSQIEVDIENDKVMDIIINSPHSMSAYHVPETVLSTVQPQFPRNPQD